MKQYGQCTVLMIDDSTEDRALVQRFLRYDIDVTYLFLEASTAEIGLALCHQHRPDCILLDYNLPDLSGDELLQIVIESAELPAYPVMMLTGKGNERLAVRSLLGGAQDYIVKDGLTPEALIRALGNAVQKVRNERSG